MREAKMVPRVAGLSHEEHATGGLEHLGCPWHVVEEGGRKDLGQELPERLQRDARLSAPPRLHRDCLGEEPLLLVREDLRLDAARLPQPAAEAGLVEISAPHFAEAEQFTPRRDDHGEQDGSPA